MNSFVFSSHYIACFLFHLLLRSRHILQSGIFESGTDSDPYYAAALNSNINLAREASNAQLTQEEDSQPEEGPAKRKRKRVSLKTSRLDCGRRSTAEFRAMSSGDEEAPRYPKRPDSSSQEEGPPTLKLMKPPKVVGTDQYGPVRIIKAQYHVEHLINTTSKGPRYESVSFQHYSFFL